MRSAESLCTLLEIGTGDCFAKEIALFGEPNERRIDEGSALVKSLFDYEKEGIAKRAMSTALNAFGDGVRVKRILMRLGPTAVSRRVTETAKSTFGHQPRKQPYGKRRWKTDTGALVAAERASLTKD